MEVLMLTVFVSLTIAACGVLFFAWNVHQRAHEHIDQLSLLPLDEELPPSAAGDRGHDRTERMKGT